MKYSFTAKHLTVFGSFPNCCFKASRRKRKKRQRKFSYVFFSSSIGWMAVSKKKKRDEGEKEGRNFLNLSRTSPWRFAYSAIATARLLRRDDVVPTLLAGTANWQNCQIQMTFRKNLLIFGGLVLGCIKAKICKKICVRQHFSSSTRFA